MRAICGKLWRRTVLAAVVACTALSAAAQSAIPAEAFFQDAEYSQARMSANGRHVAMVAGAKGVRMGLVVVDLSDMSARVVARFPNADVGWAWWLNDKRLVFSVLNIKPGDTDSRSGTYAVDVDGSNLIGLEKTGANVRRFSQIGCGPCGNPGGGTLIHHSSEKTDNFFVNVNFLGSSGIGKVNSRTKIVDEVFSREWPFLWIIDDDERTRVTLNYGDEGHILYYREKEGDWRKVHSFAPGSPNAFTPVFLANRTLYVSSRKGGNYRAIYRYDLDKARIADEPLISAPDFDVDVDWLSDGKKVSGVRVTTDSERTVWFDPEMKKLQEELDALLPNTINNLQRPYRGETPYILISAYSPAQPATYMVFNRETKKLTQLGVSHPRIDPAAMGSMQFVRYQARDGLSIPAYLTLPRTGSGKNLPAVVLAGDHLGERNGTWAWQAEAQFLASRGYAVIQPQIRGTPGFGKAHADAGFKQYGRKMQDDLADGASWAIAQGIADPKRICIAGSAAGGFAAMTGVEKDAALFRCAVNVSGFGAMPAASVKQPVLLAYGAQDEIGPAAQGKKLADAIRAGGNAEVEFHVYDEKGQDWSLANNRIDLWTKIERFLERHIGKR